MKLADLPERQVSRHNNPLCVDRTGSGTNPRLSPIRRQAVLENERAVSRQRGSEPGDEIHRLELKLINQAQRGADVVR